MASSETTSHPLNRPPLDQNQALQSKVNQVFGGSVVKPVKHTTPSVHVVAVAAEADTPLADTPIAVESDTKKIFIQHQSSTSETQTSEDGSVVIPQVQPPPPAHLTIQTTLPVDVNAFQPTSPLPIYTQGHAVQHPDPTLLSYQDVLLASVVSPGIPVYNGDIPHASPSHRPIHSISLVEVLNATAPAPVDLDSFRSFCRKNQVDDHLDFWLVIEHTFRHVKTEDSYIHVIDYILETYLLTPPRILSSIPIHLVKSTLTTASKARKIAKRTEELDTTVFDDMQQHLYKLLNDSVFPVFKKECVINSKLEEMRQETMWWKRPIVLAEFFSFPNPVNSGEVRVVCALNFVGLAIIAFGGYPLCAFLLYGYLARLLAGRRLDIFSHIVLFFILPATSCKLRFLPTEFVAGPPKRFAEFMSASLMLIYSLHVLVMPLNSIAIWVILLILLLHTLITALFNKCFFSWMFEFALYRHWLPKSIKKACDEGNNYLERQLSPK